jgi:hypothetical protein
LSMPEWLTMTEWFAMVEVVMAPVVAARAVEIVEIWAKV